MIKRGESMIDAYGAKDTGFTRTINQDYIYYSVTPIGSLPNLLIIADGMGGHKAGDYASRLTVEKLIEFFTEHRFDSIVTAFNEGVKLVNHVVVKKAEMNPDYYGMGTTLVLATVLNNILYVANVGDSRLYIIDEDIIQVTRDHSYVEELVALGKIERNSQEYNNRKNIITKAIGNADGVIPDFFEVDIKNECKLLLCSDGLTNMLTNEMIFKIVNEHSNIKESVTRLIDEANKNGGRDNISVILAKVH